MGAAKNCKAKKKKKKHCFAGKLQNRTIEMYCGKQKTNKRQEAEYTTTELRQTSWQTHTTGVKSITHITVLHTGLLPYLSE